MTGKQDATAREGTAIGSIIRKGLEDALENRDPESRVNFDKEAGDYIGEDGLLYCGKCKTKKETVVTWPANFFSQAPEEKKMRVPCTCKCRQEEVENRKKEEEYQAEMARIQRMRDASMMDSKYRNAHFSSYLVNSDNQRAYKTAVGYANRFEEMYQKNQGIIFYGPVGTGKSYTAACIANKLLDNRQTVIMTSFVKILQNIQNTDEAEYISMLNRAKLLVLDDLGTERNTDFALEKVYNIIDSRSRANKPMVLTTNLTIDEMMNTSDIRYKRIYDRIFETCFPLNIPGESFRMISAEKRFDEMSKLMEG